MKYRSIYELNKTQQYIMQMRPILRKHALFSDGTSDYRIPQEPECNSTVSIRFRTAKDNVDMVWLCTKEEQFEMEFLEHDGTFDYYTIDLPIGEETFYYSFRIMSGLLECRYDRYGITKDFREQYQFCIIPGFHTPEWSKGAVMYQILVDRFYNGDTANDVLDNEYFYIRTPSKRVPAEQWDKCPENFSVAEFYGGDLEGVRQKLDYLQSLGIEAIYFNPLFVSPSNHKYDIQDYEYIDPHYGVIIEDQGELISPSDQDNRKASRYIRRVTNKRNLEASNELFAKLVEEAHERGIRVILDGVFNHCGSYNKWMDREQIYTPEEGYQPGAYVSADSPYRNYFGFSNQNAWPQNNTYEGWWGHDTLPKLNYEGSKELYEHILSIAKKWVSPPYNADGWRLDVAADLGHSPEVNHRFWRDFRNAVKEANPEAIILAEHYGDPKDWLQGDQWDTIMNYSAFMEPVTWFLTGMEKHSDESHPETIGKISDFEGAMRHYMASFQTSSLQCAMNELSNHDHSRFLTRTNHVAGRSEFLGTAAASENLNYGVMREAVLLQMTWPGAPTIYYGDEAGVCGFTDPDNRRTYPWGHEDVDLIDLHRELIWIHKDNEALRTGSVKFLQGQENLLCYGRFNRTQQFVVLINNADVERDIEISVWNVGMPVDAYLKQVIVTTENGYSIMPVIYQLEKGILKIKLARYSGVLLEHVDPKDM